MILHRIPAIALSGLLLAGAYSSYAQANQVAVTEDQPVTVTTVSDQTSVIPVRTGWDAYWKAVKTAQPTVNSKDETRDLRELIDSYRPADMFGADDDTLNKAASALSDETSKIVAQREKAKHEAEEKKRAEEKAKQQAESERQAAAGSSYVEQSTEQYVASSQAVQESVTTSADTSASGASGGYSTNSGCTDMYSCQSANGTVHIAPIQ